MSRKRIYLPSETDLALHPPRTLIDCPCGVRFEARVSTSPDSDSEDDPNLCLTCNRKSWSRLWNDNQPVAIPGTHLETAARETIAEIQEATELAFNLTSDSDIGEVISIKRGKR